MPQNDQDHLLAQLVAVRDEMTAAVDKLETQRTRRDELICAARRAGATVDVIAHDGGVNRQMAHRILAQHGVAAPPRTRSSAAQRARLELSRALDAAGIDTRNPDELGRAVLDALHRDTEPTGD